MPLASVTALSLLTTRTAVTWEGPCCRCIISLKTKAQLTRAVKPFKVKKKSARGQKKNKMFYREREKIKQKHRDIVSLGKTRLSCWMWNVTAAVTEVMWLQMKTSCWRWLWFVVNCSAAATYWWQNAMREGAAGCSVISAKYTCTVLFFLTYCKYWQHSFLFIYFYRCCKCGSCSTGTPTYLSLTWFFSVSVNYWNVS